MLFILTTLANAQNLTALLNPGLSMQCQLAINSRVTELMSFCLSPYDLKNIEAPNTIDALMTSFSFLPTVCSPDCKRAFTAFGNSVGRTCRAEVLVNPELGMSIIPSLVQLVQGLSGLGSAPAQPPVQTVQTVVPAATTANTATATFVPTNTARNLTLVKRQVQQDLPKALAQYFSSLNTQNLITLVQAIQSLACVKNAPTQVEAANLLDNKYCLKDQYQSFSKVSSDKLPETIGRILSSREVCNVCFQHQFFVLGQAGRSIPVFGVLGPLVTRVNEGIRQCPGLPKLDQSVLVSSASALTTSFFLISLFML